MLGLCPYLCCSLFFFGYHFLLRNAKKDHCIAIWFSVEWILIQFVTHILTQVNCFSNSSLRDFFQFQIVYFHNPYFVSYEYSLYLKPYGQYGTLLIIINWVQQIWIVDSSSLMKIQKIQNWEQISFVVRCQVL